MKQLKFKVIKMVSRNQVNRIRNKKYQGKHLPRVKKRSKVTSSQTIRKLKIKVGNKSVERPCVVYKYHGKRKVHVLEDWRLAELITNAQARQAFEKRSKKAKTTDLASRAKKVYPSGEATTSYLVNPGRSDVEGIDTPRPRKLPKDRVREEYDKIDFNKNYTDLISLSKDFHIINNLLYNAESLNEIAIKKLEQRRDYLLERRIELKESIKPKSFNYYNSETRLDIKEIDKKYYRFKVGFDYETYRDLSNNTKEQWRKCARWDPDEKKWFVYKNKSNDAIDLLYDNKLISKKPEKLQSLSDQYLTDAEKKKDTLIIEIDNKQKIAKIDGNFNELKKIDNFYSYYVKGYKYSQAYKDGKWDGKAHIVNLSNRTLPPNLAYNIIENKEEIDPNLHIKIVDFRENAIRKDQIKLKDVKLYDYQQEAVSKAIDGKQGLIVIATGGGKTEVASGVIGEFGKDNDAIFLVHTTALQDQAEERLERRLGIDVGIGGGVKHNIKDTKKGDINVVTLQSLYQALKTKEQKKELTEKQKEIIKAYKDAELIIQDEAHHVKADTFKNVIDQADTKHIIGLTATPYRDENDEKEVYSRFGKKIIDINADKLINKGRLVPPTINMISVPATKEAREISSTYRSGTKKYNAIRNAQIINNEERNHLIKKLAQNQEEEGKTNLIFVDRIAHGKKLAKLLNKPFLNGQDQSKKNRDKNQEVISKVAKGEIKTVIATQQLFGEGFDLPAIDSLIIADAGGMSKVKTMQRAGRALRTKEGKKLTEIYDFNDKIEYLGEHADQRLGTYKTNKTFTINELSINELKEKEKK